MTSLGKGTPSVTVGCLLALAVAFSPAGEQSKRKTAKKGVLSQPPASPTTRKSSAFADTVKAAPVPKPQKSDSSARLNQPPPTAFQFRKISNTAFKMGERLVFDVNYGFITAGEAVLTIPSYELVAGRSTYRVEFNVHSLSSFNWIFRVEDHYLTFIDVEAIAPLRFEQHIREGSYARDFVADFDQENHVARTSEGEHNIPPYVHDIMSAFYYVRTFDLSNVKDGEMMLMHNFYKDTTYDLGIRVLGRQELEVTAGTFRTIVVEPLVKEGGLFKSEGRIVIWLTDDEFKIPVRVNTKVVIGSIDTELREFSGLSGPIRSRIK